jgi:hypothetical protein
LVAPAAQAAPPAVTTGSATNIHFDRAKLEGTVNPGGVALEECVFKYGETEAYSHSAPCEEPSAAEVGSGNSPVTVHADIVGLAAGHSYHFRLTGKSASEPAAGSDQTFETPEGPELKLTVTPDADYVLPGSQYSAEYKLEIENVGDEPTDGGEAITIENVAPAGTHTLNSFMFSSQIGEYFNLAKVGMCPSAVQCIYTSGFFGAFFSKELQIGQRLVMTSLVEVPTGVEGPLEDVFKVSGGGLPLAEAGGTNTADPNPPFGTMHLDAAITDASKSEAYTQAGGHPYQFSTEFQFGDYSTSQEVNPSFPNWQAFGAAPVGDPKEVDVELPPGLLANPQGVPHCQLAEYFGGECAVSTAVGWAGIRSNSHDAAFNRFQPVFNLQPTGAYPAELGIPVAGVPFVVITGGIRSSGDYGATAANVAIQAGLNRFRLTLWGVPADPSHDNLRAKNCTDSSATDWAPKFYSIAQIEHACETGTGNVGWIEKPAEVPPTPFLTMPTECSGQPLAMHGSYNSWQDPNQYASGEVELPPVDGCNALSFEPTIESRPTTILADAPSGLEFDLHVPQNEDPEGVATPELKEAVVKFPSGLTLNPASGDGLSGCTEAEIGLHVEAPAACPEASKLGSAEVLTPLLHEPLKGSLYLATPHQNPAGSLLAGYLAFEGEGVRIKLPGSFETDKATGQVTAKFLQNPQLPFEDLKVDIFGGARGALRTPATCGAYQTTSVLTPFSAPESGPPATPSTSFHTEAAAHEGEACPTSAGGQPNAPLLHAGTETPQAGIYSPLSLKLVREDGSQEVTSIDTTLPPGLVGKLAGIPYCSEAAIAAAATKRGQAEKAAPSCPAASEVGTVDVGAGAGPTPINVSGHAYLAGPYKGAPISLAIITPALAGPFDLGTVVVRAALYVNPETTQIHAVSDPIPTILEGIPLDLRSVTLKASRPNFTLNPTDCTESAFTGSALSVLDVSAPLADRFQVGGCPALAFKPSLALNLKGGTKRRGHPAITAVLKMPSGGANIASTEVALPPSEILDNAHIQSPCTRVEFAAGGCPAGSVLGSARAITPLLDQPLEGPVYLMTGFGHTLPDLVADLHGQIHVAVDGKIDSTKAGGLRTTFAAVPDAPVSKFVLALKGHAKGLIQNSVDLCKSPQRATATFTGHNAKSLETVPLLKTSCPKHHAKHKRHHHRSHRVAG